MASAAEPATTDILKKEPNYKTFEIYRWVNISIKKNTARINKTTPTES